MSQIALANLMGVSQSTVSGWVTGALTPSLNHFIQLCDILKVSANELLFEELTEDKLSNFKWLFSINDVMGFEAQVDVASDEIWIITTTLKNDLPGGDAVEIVRANINRGLTYVYHVPKPEDNPDIRFSINRLKSLTFRGHDEKVKILPLPDFYKYITYTNAIVFNPLPKSEMETDMYFELPIGTNRWWVKVHKDLTSKYVGQIINLVKGSSEL